MHLFIKISYSIWYPSIHPSGENSKIPLFPSPKPLPGKKREFLHVKTRVPSHPVVFKPVKIQSASSPVATVTNAIAYKFGFHSRIPVRNHGKPFKKESPADPLPDLACHLVPNCRPKASLNDFPLIPYNRIDIKSADEALLVQSQEIVWDPEE